MTQKSIFSDFKGKWNLLAVSASVIFTVLITFITALPQLSVEEDFKISFFVKFLIAALIGLLTVPLLQKSNKSDYRFWLSLSWTSIILALLLFSAYFHFREKWSVIYYNEIRLIIGKNMTSEALKKKTEIAKELNRPTVNDEVLVKSRNGETHNIWPFEEIQYHFYLLALLYIGSFVLFTLFMLSVIQSIFCYEKTG